MAKRTLNAIALLITKRVDKSSSDTQFITFVEDMLTLTLQEIISVVPHARWLLDEDSVTTAASTQYVAIPSDMDIDAIISARDETNNRPLIRIAPEDADSIDPGRDLTGDEIVYWFQRVAGVDRLYFLAQPDSVDTLKFIFGNTVTDPTTSQTTALPAKYEYGWIEGTMPKLAPRIQGLDVRLHQANFEKFLDVVKRDANTAPSESQIMASHRPSDVKSTVGPSWPADFDIT